MIGGSGAGGGGAKTESLKGATGKQESFPGPRGLENKKPDDELGHKRKGKRPTSRI